MPIFYLSMALAVAANIAYHLCQKTIPSQANPLVSLIVTYTVALTVSVISLPIFYPGTGLVAGLRSLNWASFVLGVGIIGLELGFLMVYRAGWNLSIGALYANVLVTLLLIPVGVLVYKESLSVQNALGIVLALIGLILMVKR
jgi:hypothetical protein